MDDPNNYGKRIKRGIIRGDMTIDQSRSDNGYLQHARKGYEELGAKLHTTAIVALDNLEQSLGGPNTSINIVGHGEIGRISTGAGASTSIECKFIGISNLTHWRKDMSDLKNEVTNLYLWSCHTGAGINGARLLTEIANIIGAEVAAPTEIITCLDGDFEIENNGTWQVAKPGIAPPSPIDPPQPEIYFREKLQLNSSSGMFVLHADNIIRIEIVDPWTHYIKHIYPPAEIRWVLKYTDFMEPFELHGVPGAIITGAFIIRYNYGGGLYARKYTVYNNRFFTDNEFPLTAYYCNTSIAESLV
jgi:hypothetical protein